MRSGALTLKSDGPRVWDEEPFDSIPFYTAMEYLKARKPRVLFISFGETDDWAHGGYYAEYLHAAHRVDSYLKILWETVQSMPEYRDRTTLIFAPDHGRGRGRRSWKDHGQKIPESKYIWMAFLGPDTPVLGERMDVGAVSQNQIATTLTALLDEDYMKDVPKAGRPIGDVMRH
jgi:Type I phosphodiesterase / nucleotide pyrophosphatase